jgi:hypothetical protein
VWSMSIGMPGGSACERVCIATGVAVIGGACEWRKENRVHHWHGYRVSGGTSGGIMEPHLQGG